ncbi:Phosphotransferase enzyme family domain protein [Penicillium desertorum]|uniref:Phosphotransferase enzyme family domain protein n=1 Tax=Penicillium desertorum TaxID=1303715 RepID=A0A9W9WRN6_9EURO|nr:Phosphotransferase enzyme family domain protein [Penicillium desertorum]
MADQVLQPVDVPSLEQYLQSAVPEIQTPIYVKQYTGGQSNPTYQLTAADDKRFVLRKKPPGQLLSRNLHQIEREYTIFQALKESEVPVPKHIALIGTPFSIMEHLDGRIFLDSTMTNVSASERPELQPFKCSHVPMDLTCAAGLQSFGKPGRYYDRQIALFKSLAKSYANVVNVETNEYVGELAHFSEMVDFFSRSIYQPKDRTAIIHGGFKIDNLVFRMSEPRIIGVLDWEMATLGHPLADICNLTHPYFWARLDQNVRSFQPEQVSGLPSREDCIRWYAGVNGWDPTTNLPWGDAFFMLFRTTVFVQSITARYARRQASKAQEKYVGREVQYAADTWRQLQQVKEMKQQSSRSYKL